MTLVWNGIEIRVLRWEQVPVYAPDGKTVLWVQNRLVARAEK